MEKRSDIRRNISIFATEQERNIPPRSERIMEKISLHPIKQDTRLEIPIAVESVHAGFPSPAQDYMEDGIDLNKELVRHPASTFYARVAGNSMKDAGINPGDILVVDKLLEPKEGDIAVCFIDGEYTLKVHFVTPCPLVRLSRASIMETNTSSSEGLICSNLV